MFQDELNRLKALVAKPRWFTFLSAGDMEAIRALLLSHDNMIKHAGELSGTIDLLEKKNKLLRTQLSAEYQRSERLSWVTAEVIKGQKQLIEWIEQHNEPRENRYGIDFEAPNGTGKSDGDAVSGQPSGCCSSDSSNGR